MKEVYYGQDGPDGDEPGVLEIPERWPFPPSLIRRDVDSKTGLLKSFLCPEDRAYPEIFLPGTEPTQLCGAGQAQGRRREAGGGSGLGRGGSGGGATP